jgi:hypothetical protein
MNGSTNSGPGRRWLLGPSARTMTAAPKLTSSTRTDRTGTADMRSFPHGR